MKQEEFRQILIDGTIRVIARDGIDKASAKQIETETGINPVYIYRCFKDKEDMFAKVFDYLDDELASAMMTHVAAMYIKDLDYRERCRLFYNSIWSFLLSNREKCLAYVRYYYSPYFMKLSSAQHKKRFAPLVEKFGDAFKAESNIWMILNHILNVLLDFAVKVHNGQMPANDDYSEHVFRVIYRSVEQYFKREEVKHHDE